MYSPPPPPGPYGQPAPGGVPWNQPGQPGPPLPPKRSKAPLIILLVGGLVIAVVIVGAVAFFAATSLSSSPSDGAAPRAERTATSASPTTSGVPASYSGTWRGKLTTTSGDWSISVTLLSGMTAGSVQYYENDKGTCQGTMTFSAMTDTTLTMTEATPGCKTPGGVVTLTMNGANLFYKWYENKEKQDADSSGYTGLLTRS